MIFLTASRYFMCMMMTIFCTHHGLLERKNLLKISTPKGNILFDYSGYGVSSLGNLFSKGRLSVTGSSVNFSIKINDDINYDPKPLNVFVSQLHKLGYAVDDSSQFHMISSHCELYLLDFKALDGFEVRIEIHYDKTLGGEHNHVFCLR